MGSHAVGCQGAQCGGVLVASIFQVVKAWLAPPLLFDNAYAQMLAFQDQDVHTEVSVLLHSLAGRQTLEFFQAWQTVCCPHALSGGHCPYRCPCWGGWGEVHRVWLSVSKEKIKLCIFPVALGCWWAAVGAGDWTGSREGGLLCIPLLYRDVGFF